MRCVLMGQIDYVEIGKRIKRKRNEFHMTQEKLAEEIDVSPSYISEIERGTSISSLATIFNIATVLELNLDYLICGITPNNVDSTFAEIVQSLPENNRKLYLDICKNISETLK